MLVHVVLHNEDPKQLLRGGKTYSEFVEELQLAISAQYTTQNFNKDILAAQTTLTNMSLTTNSEEVKTAHNTTILNGKTDVELLSPFTSPPWHGWATSETLTSRLTQSITLESKTVGNQEAIPLGYFSNSTHVDPKEVVDLSVSCSKN